MTDHDQDAPSLAERLNETGTKLAELSKKATVATKAGLSATAEVSKMAATKAAEVSKNAVTKANSAVKTVVDDSKAKLE